jgi:hypothetical protein
VPSRQALVLGLAAVALVTYFAAMIWNAHLQWQYKQERKTPQAKQALEIATKIECHFYPENKTIRVFFDLDEVGKPTLFVCGLKTELQWSEAKTLASELREMRQTGYPLKMLFFEYVPNPETDLDKMLPIHKIEF